MADYDWFPERHEARMKQQAEDNANRARGFHPVYMTLGSALNSTLVYYQCRRGCGTLVHDIEAHIKNVCPRFEPLVGQGSEPS